MPPLPAVAKAERLPAVLTPLQALGVVVGGTIGASIFLVPSVVAQRVPFVAGALGIWLAGALMNLAGALTISEMGAMLPDAGGGYVYIRAALGPLFGFLFAWTDALLIRAGAAATVGFTFAIYFAQLVPPPKGVPVQLWEGCAAALLLVLLGALNYRGAKAGADVQVAGTALKSLALGSALILALVLWRGPNGLLSAPFLPVGGMTASGGLVAALIPVMWTYGGWEQLAHLTEEIQEPTKNLPRVFAAGLLSIGALYLAVAIGIHYVLPFAAVAKSQAVGADLFRALLGPAGGSLISIVIMLSAMITANGAVMAGPRTAFALARDGDAPHWLAKIHPRYLTPSNAVIATGAWSILLIVVSVAAMTAAPPRGIEGWLADAWRALQTRPLFDVLLSYVMFGYLFLQVLVAVSLIVLRRSHPEWTRPFRVPWYPVTPLISMAGTVFLMLALMRSNSLEALAGVCLILLGLVARWSYRRALPSERG